MSGDLIARLRGEADACRLSGADRWGDLFDEAAAELEARRLHVECAQCSAPVLGVVCADCGTRAIHTNGGA